MTKLLSAEWISQDIRIGFQNEGTMGVIENNVIPGEKGRIFGTDASRPRDFERITEVLLKINGVKEVIWNREVFPIELCIKTDVIVSNEEIEKSVNAIAFHVIPKHDLPF